MKFFKFLLITIISFFTIIPVLIAGDADDPQPLARLFTVPKGRVLESMDVSLTLGGAFGSMNKGEYLGIASVGLGNVAELEISTYRLVSNLFKGTTALGTTALSVNVLKGTDDNYIPDVAITFRANPSWAQFEALHGDIVDDLSSLVNEVQYEMHMAALYVTFSKQLMAGFTLHGGLSLTDVRTRNGEAILAGSPALTDIPDLQKNLYSGFIGIERNVNEQTILMAEVSGVPRFNYKPAVNILEADQVALIVAGFRFYFTPRISTDAGVKYRSDYAGIADAEISVGLNVGFSLESVAAGIRNK